MESNNTEQHAFEFLNDAQVQRHFAELNIELLRGKHIMPSSSTLFALLDEHTDSLANYYATLYGLNLEKRTHDNLTYFYLEFPSYGKGRLTNPNFYIELDAKSTIVACVLANIYFSNFFSYDKIVVWDEIQYEIENGEHREAYQQLFFNDIRPDYTDKEWDNVKKQMGSVINFFDRIGLVEKNDEEEDLHFTILPTIHHFIDMYKNEIENIDAFLNEIKL